MIEGLLLSVDEPQLGRCLESMDKQTVPFSNIVHINNITPQSEAYNRGILMLRGEWFLLTAGDVYLHPDAVEKCMEKIEEYKNNNKVIGHLFRLYDAFIKMYWGGIGVFRTDILKFIPLMDRLANDHSLGRKLDKYGWGMRKHYENIAVHFDSPDEFQVFRRFYVAGLKYNGRAISDMGCNLNNLLKKTDNSLYLIAMKAIEFAGKKRIYPGSHNIDFDKKMYEEFNESLQKA
jgi:glycosyltransferase involved in cell wall biosynthesis